MLVHPVASVAGQPKLERRVAVLPPTPEGPVGNHGWGHLKGWPEAR